jgi:glycosyltransferase involved in cell wall biosynthesis
MIVCSGSLPEFSLERNQSFIFDQVKEINALNRDVSFSFFFIRGKGAFGYLKNLKNLKKQIDIEKPDLIHAHYGFSGLLANLQRKVNVITTFHGTDINVTKYRIISRICHFLGSFSIFVSNDLLIKLNPHKNFAVIPCGVDFNIFRPIEMYLARQALGLTARRGYILFSSFFNNAIKNYPLAQKAKDLLDDENIEIIEFKGYSRQESSLLFNAVDVALVTSFSEGSPQFIKEAMACNCPIVTTNVGDVKDVINNTEGCFISSFDPADVAESISLAIEFSLLYGRTNGREKIMEYDNKIIAGEIYDIYKKVVENGNSNS